MSHSDPGKTTANPADKAWRAIEQTWIQGRKVLVVIGAGASVASGVPRMRDIFGSLRERIENLAADRTHTSLFADCGKDDEPFAPVQRRLQDLAGKLKALEKEHAPRSDASIALGSLQRAGERLREGPLQRHLHELWITFTNDFIAGRIGATPGTNGRIGDREPSNLHRMVAHWAAERRAALISLNFDGLTASAVRAEMKARGSGIGVVISKSTELEQFFLGEAGGGPASDRGLVPVVKVWGDVFHAVCKNHQCPEHDKKIAAYDLGTVSTESGKDECPTCKTPRQLQIFFTGYEEKEKSANELMHQLLRFVAPEVGCILTVGFSGLWDRALVDFLCLLAADLQREDRNRRGLVADDEPWESTPVWINVDPKEQPPLHQEISAHGISQDHLFHISMESERFCDAIKDRAPATPAHGGDGYDGAHRAEGFWEQLVNAFERDGAVQKPLPASYKHLVGGNYLWEFGRLRQIGIKTRINSDPNTDDTEHNRLRHSSGAAHLAIVWFRKLARQAKNMGLLAPRDEEWLASTVLYAAMHHDIGHIPFSHLSEEVFAEVRWTLEEWGDPFRHDQPVLASCIKEFQKDIFDATESTVGRNQPKGFNGYAFRVWIESAIQGRTGRHWVDAILNSPLDADKLDYVFRDCHYLNQGLHLPLAPKERQEWVKVFFDNTRLLPSGLIALEGPSGDRAQEFLEERCWLYKHQYFDAGFRAIERLCSAVILHWLLYEVPVELVKGECLKKVRQGLSSVGDTSSLKGQQARDLLWRQMHMLEPKAKGEPELIVKLAEELANLANQTNRTRGLRPPDKLKDWAHACRSLFEKAFKGYSAKGSANLLEFLTKNAGMSCSETVYICYADLEKVRELVRELETSRAFGALFDIAVMPSVLSYPSRRRLKFEGVSVLGECFAVSDRDPERWSRSSGTWIPLSASAFGDRDKHRSVRIMVVSPWPNDPSVPHAMDRFRDMSRIHGIDVRDVDPGHT